jgi:hypothetical protein
MAVRLEGEGPMRIEESMIEFCSRELRFKQRLYEMGAQLTNFGTLAHCVRCPT